MNRTLKRPMFRMGGSSATGITSGLDTPRASYQFGGGAGMAADNIRLSDLPFMKNQMASQSTEGNVTSDASSLTGGQQLLKAFDITDYEIVLPQPEEKAENTRLSFAQQKISVASQFATLGFDVKLKEQNVDLYEAEFVVKIPLELISPEAVKLPAIPKPLFVKLY